MDLDYDHIKTLDLRAHGGGKPGSESTPTKTHEATRKRQEEALLLARELRTANATDGPGCWLCGSVAVDAKMLGGHARALCSKHS